MVVEGFTWTTISKVGTTIIVTDVVAILIEVVFVSLGVRYSTKGRVRQTVATAL